MHATTRILIATIVLGTAANSYAKSPQQLISQFAKSYQGKSPATSSVRRVTKNRHFGGTFKSGGSGHFQPPHFGGGSHCEKPYCPPTPPVFPPPHCDDHHCPPPRPVCYVYIVYYYDCHVWTTYGTYHRAFDAQHAVDDLQHQGYRAYYQKVVR